MKYLVVILSILFFCSAGYAGPKELDVLPADHEAHKCGSHTVYEYDDTIYRQRRDGTFRRVHEDTLRFFVVMRCPEAIWYLRESQYKRNWSM